MIPWKQGSNVIYALMNSQRLRQHTQGLLGSELDGVLELKGKVNTCPYP